MKLPNNRSLAPHLSILRLTITFLIILSFNINAIPKEKPSKNENSKWNLVHKDNEIELYERWIIFPDERKTRERKGIFYVTNEIEEIIELVTSDEGIKSWMKRVEKSEELTENTEELQVIYLHFDVPWPFKDKDLIANITTNNTSDLQGKKIHYTANAGYLPLKKGVERLKSYEATWTITTLSPGCTEIIFTAYSDTPPIAPRCIQDPVTEKLFKENLLNLRQILLEMELNKLSVSK